MVATGAQAVLRVPARDVPVPSFLSPQAQTILGMGLLQVDEYPPLEDLDGWRAMVASRDEVVRSIMVERVSAFDGEVEEIDRGGTRIFVITPAGTSDEDQRVYLDFHGGGLIMGGGDICRAMGIGAASSVGRRTWTVDYRMPPDFPYPAALDDAVATYGALLDIRGPEQIIVGGASAGGNLAAALILRARDEGLPLPAAAILQTPEVDLTESGDSFRTNLGLDTVLTGSLMPANLLYAAGHDLAHPYLSPLFGDFAKGFPPTFLTTGTRDLFLSNTVRMHRALRAADVQSELHVMEAAPHGGFFGTAPEDAQVTRDLRRFVALH
jgi:epsilon-lactone hydrolase